MGIQEQLDGAVNQISALMSEHPNYEMLYITNDKRFVINDENGVEVASAKMYPFTLWSYSC